MEKKNNNKTSSKTTKKNTLFKKKRKIGFTLIEFIIFLIVFSVVVLGLITFGTNYFNSESKRSYIDLAKNVIKTAKKNVDLGNYKLFDADTTYYIESTCIKSKNLPQTTYGELLKAYVIVTFSDDTNGNTYYWTSVSESGYGIKKIVRFDLLSNDFVVSDLTVDDITTDRGIDGRSKIEIIDQSSNCNEKKEGTVIYQVDGNTGDIIY